MKSQGGEFENKSWEPVTEEERERERKKADFLNALLTKDLTTPAVTQEDGFPIER